MGVSGLFLAVFLLPWYGVRSRSSGPPVGDHHPDLCPTMSPESRHLPRNVTGDAPYTISVRNMSNSTKIVTLEANKGFTFKGFFIQARSADDCKSDALGTFSNIPPGSQLLKCTSDADAWGHSNPEEKTRVTATWTPPVDAGNIVFQATVVKSLKAYWEEIRSQPLPCSATKSCPGLYVTFATMLSALTLILWRQ